MWDDKGLPYFQGGKAGRTGCQARFGIKDIFGFIGIDVTSTLLATVQCSSLIILSALL